MSTTIRFALGANPEARKLLTRSDPEAIAQLNAFAAERKIPFYSNWFKFYGPEEVVRGQWAYAKKRMSDIAGIQFVDGPFYKFHSPTIRFRDCATRKTSACRRSTRSRSARARTSHPRRAAISASRR